MKKLISLFSLVLFCTLFTSKGLAQLSDADFVKNWQAGTGAHPTKTPPYYPDEGFVQKQALATKVANDFDPSSVIFDELWPSLPNEYSITNVVKQTNGDDAGGDADFKGAFKIVYNDDAFYILLQCSDDVVTGSEKVEIMWQQDEKIEALASLDKDTEHQRFAYLRYEAFGGYKVEVTSSGGKSVMTWNPNASNVITVYWSGSATAQTLIANNVLLESHAEGSTTQIKNIYTINYPALTGEMREDFNVDKWKGLNGGKGISFDLKFVEHDPNKKMPAYWWNSPVNNGYLYTWY
ncbi:MAG: sugar-binding protein, partial [Dysgonomonas sp.]